MIAQRNTSARRMIGLHDAAQRPANTGFMFDHTRSFLRYLPGSGPQLAGLLLGLGLAASGLTPALAGPMSQVAPTAPENLRCPGRPAPPLPGPGWRVEPVWAWQDLLHVEGVIGIERRAVRGGRRSPVQQLHCGLAALPHSEAHLRRNCRGAVVVTWRARGRRVEQSARRGGGRPGQRVRHRYAEGPRVQAFSPGPGDRHVGRVRRRWRERAMRSCPAVSVARGDRR